MNKRMYRIIFNKAREVFMAVAEIAVSNNKAAGATQAPHGAAESEISAETRAKMRPLTFACLMVFGTAMALASFARADIIADTGAPRNQQPTVLNAANGVPQVNIQTPSAAGVSRNTYSQFDVQTQGAILNNSRTSTQTQLGGWIQGNPWLATGTARVILNEVNSANPSLLRGYVEVAGSKAQVVIANPAGVTCDGCGFINASRATLTTGAPIVNGGSLDGYVVQRGVVTVQGAGLDASQTDFTEIIARAVQVNAGIWAKELTVTTGANQVSADHAQITSTAGTGAAPVFALDVAQLGGMYAGKIMLVGTEAGVGVRNAGQIGANAGELVLTADGHLSNSGRISSAANARIDANGGIVNSGTVYSERDAYLAARGNIENSGSIVSQGNTTLAATGSASQINSSAGSVLGGGINSGGTLAASGRLNVSATQSISAHGQNLAGGDQVIIAQALDLTNSQTSAQNVTLAATSGDIDASGATVAAIQTLNANAAQTFRNDDAKTSANQLNLAAHDLSNVRGELVQVGSGDTSIILPGSLDNTRGRIAGNSRNLSLAGQSLTNADGKIEHAGSGTLAVDAAMFSGTRGSLSSNGSLTLTAQTATLDAGNLVAGQVKIDAATLSNRAGEIIQSGTGDTSIKASSKFDNTGGTLASNGNITFSLGDLINQGGAVQAAGASNLTVSATGVVDNRGQGNLNAGRNVNIGALEIHNAQGQITAGSSLQTTATNAIDNSHGILAANQGVTLVADSVNNNGGTTGSVQGSVSVATTGGNLNNTAGRIEAAQSVNLASTGLTNNGGVVSGQEVNLDSRAHAFDNSQGTIAARGALDIQSGLLTNDAGLIQAAGAASIDTHGQTLANTHSGGTGGIIGQSTVTLNTGDVNNQAGFIGAKGNLSANSAAISNTQGGLLSSEQAITLTGSGLDNQGGQIQALDDVSVKVGAGSVNNGGSLMRSGKTLQIEAGSVTNANTQGANQGIEGQSVNIAANQIDNSTGAVRADDALTLTGSGNLNNTHGLISSGKTAAVMDAHAGNPALKTQAITNTGGTLIAGESLSVDSANLTGDGKVLSQGDLTVKLTGDYTHNGEFQATGTATLETTGNITNQSKLLAGSGINVKAASIDNQAGAEISAGNIHLVATDVHTLTNRGLIDGGETLIETQTLNNFGTGRIYGDHLAISATTLNNDVENGTAAVIAARNRLDIGTQTLNNREHALIFSAGDMAIGANLDANKQAAGQAGTVNNNSATLETLGSLDLSASQINNTNEHFSTQVVAISSDWIQEYQGYGSNNRYAPNQISLPIVRDSFYRLLAPDGEHDKFYRYDFTRTVSETQVAASDPGRILAASAIRIDAAALLNDKSQIIAGGALLAKAGSITNTEAPGERITTDAGTAYLHIDHQPKGCCNDWTEVIPQAYNPAPTIQSISLSPTVYRQNTAPVGTGTQVAALATNSVSQNAASVNAASVNIGNGQAVNAITQVTAINGAGGSGPATIIRTGGVNAHLPNNSLFGANPNPAGTYLIETDPRFASYRTWLSSDYLLQQLSIDPAGTQKRLGDGFYEQKLIREQVAQLTGRRFLDGYASDEAQYRALLDSSATVAKQMNLRPGISLTAAQMAALTSDIVWLVEKTIALPDGKTTQALVPQLYVRVKDGDLQASGALLAGNDVNLNLAGDLANSGTIAGRSAVALTAESVKNLGGRISGEDVAVAARADLTNLGGMIDGANSLAASAGRDLSVASATRTQASAQGTRTNIDRVAGLYVTNPGGTLTASAGRDLTLTAAQVVNAGQEGSTTLAAGNNLNLGTVSEAHSQNLAWNAKDYRKEASRTDVGATIQTTGDIRLAAGNDLNAQAANVTSDQGGIHVSAGRDVNLAAGQASQYREEATEIHDKNGWFGSKTRTTHDTVNETAALGTTLSGNTTTVQAGHDITVSGGNVVATQDTALVAGHNVTIEAATNSSNESHFNQEKKSGLFSSGGIGFTIGTQQQSVEGKSANTTAAASTIGSTQGNVGIDAGNAYRQVGSDVLAPQGNIDISARKVDITEAQNASQSEQETQFKQSGLTVALTSPVISAIQTARQMTEAAGQTKDTRLQVLAAGTAALSAKNGYDAVQAGQAVKDGNLADKAGGINISISIGASQSQSNSVQTASTAAGSTVAAGGNVNISATAAPSPLAGEGRGEGGDLTIQGSSIKAGNDISLQADGDINLLAAKNTDEQHNTNKNSSASIGVSFGTSGFGVTLAGSAGRGNADGSDVIQSNTHVEAGNKLTVASGGDTTLKGAVASGTQVVANVGGNLHIESLQDTSTYDSKQQSLGGSVTIGAGVSGSISASRSKINSTYASVTEQSGIRSGDDGFAVQVKGNTDLKGGAITSTQAAVEQDKNRFQTGDTLTTRDIQNHADYQGSAAGINLGSSVSLDGKLAPSGTGAGFGKDSGNTASTTQAAISGTGNKNARTGDTETGIAPIFDAEKVQQDINAQVQITQTFGQQAPKAVASFADSQTKTYTDAQRQKQAAEALLKTETDPQRRAQLAQLIGQADQTLAANQSQYDLWKEGGAYRVALHAATGALAGGAQGALGAGAVAGAAPMLNQLQDNVAQALKDAGANNTVANVAAQLIAQGTAAGIGAAVSGGSTAGAATAFNVDSNNRLLHPKEINAIKQRAQQLAGKDGLTTEQWEARLGAQALRQVNWNSQDGKWDDTASAYLSQLKGQVGVLPDGEGRNTVSAFQATPDQKVDNTLYANSVAQYTQFYQNAANTHYGRPAQIANAQQDAQARSKAATQTTAAAALAGGIVAAGVAPSIVAACLANPVACNQAGLTAAEALSEGGIVAAGSAVATKKVVDEASSALQGAQLDEHLRQLEKYGEAGYRELQNGRIRYYGEVTPARNSGEMAGARLVREWDPSTNATRTWYETVDHAGTVRSVAPKPVTEPLNHRIFDANGNYVGRR